MFAHALKKVAEIGARFDEYFVVHILEANGKGELVVAHLVLRESTVN